jgi:pyridoxal 5'-phosphate synthase pdxT subunit
MSRSCRLSNCSGNIGLAKLTSLWFAECSCILFVYMPFVLLSASSVFFSSRQVRTADDLEGLDGIVLPGGESTAMGLIGTSTIKEDGKTMWQCLQEFSSRKPTWGTCAGMILLAEKCVGTSAVIENGQSLIGGIDITVCRNYFGSQISSFEMETPPPPSAVSKNSFPGVFIRAPAILSAGANVEVLGRVVATPCRQAAVTLRELERKIAAGEEVVKLGVVDALERKSPQEIDYIHVIKSAASEVDKIETDACRVTIVLPGAADDTNAREVICAAKKGNLLCTAFHPELTDDHRWHEYFMQMIREAS